MARRMTMRPTLLGAIFAGGRARRFGGDKAAAAIDGAAMIEHVAARLRPQVDALVVVGRDWPGIARIEDAPAPDLGPLGALAGALAYAAREGHALVLTAGCDLPEAPRDLAARLSPAPAVIAGQPLLGLWPAALGPTLLAHLAEGGDRSMRGWIARAGARRVALEREIANINTPDDLARFLAARAEE